MPRRTGVPNYNFTPEQDAEFLRRNKAGVTMRKLANEVGCSIGVIHAAIARARRTQETERPTVNTSVTECPRCTGKGGAHYAFCFVAQLWERVMGPGFPWAPTPPWITDPPDPQGVYEDFLVGSGQMRADGDWGADGLADRYAEAVALLDDPEPEYEWYEHEWDRLPDQPQEPVAEYVTHLPDGYYDDVQKANVAERVADAPKPDSVIEREESGEPPAPEPVAEDKRKRPDNVERLRKIAIENQARDREKRENSVVQFVYDCTDTAPGARLRLDEVHAAYLNWQKADPEHRTYMRKEPLRTIIEQIGYECKAGRLPGQRGSGRPPILVHGMTLKREEQEAAPTPEEPTVRVVESSAKHPYLADRPGREIPRELRDLIEPLLTEQGWAYEKNNRRGNGKPRLVSPNGAKWSLPNTPGDYRAMANTKADLKRLGAKL